eukprot:scaffold7315_cov103-Isochrysis_galbana.AAC.4
MAAAHWEPASRAWVETARPAAVLQCEYRGMRVASGVDTCCCGSTERLCLCYLSLRWRYDVPGC